MDKTINGFTYKYVNDKNNCFTYRCINNGKLKCKSFIKITENKLDHTNASHSKACVLKKNRN